MKMILGNTEFKTKNFNNIKLQKKVNFQNNANNFIFRKYILINNSNKIFLIKQLSKIRKILGIDKDLCV